MPKRLTEDQIVAKHLQVWIEDREKSITQISHEIGIDRMSLWRSLKGRRAIRLVEALGLLRSLGMSLDELYKVEEDLRR